MHIHAGTAPRRKPARFESCLIVEDSDFDQRALSRVVNRSFAGVVIGVASTLAQARKHLRFNSASLILLDNNLPDGIGADFALELAGDIRFADIPVIIVSDWPTPFMYDKAQLAGVRHVVNKSEFGARFIHDAMRSGTSRPRLN